MFLDRAASLREMIVRSLAERGASRAQDLRAVVVQRYRKCSLQAVYQELSHLLDIGAVLKVANRYDLTLPWVCKVQQFADELSEKYYSQPSGLFSLPSAGEKLRLVFADSRRSDYFWMQCILKILSFSRSAEMFQWLPHPWHYLLYGERGKEFENALRAMKKRDYVIVGGDTYLDRSASASWRRDVFEYSHAPGPFQLNRTEYVTVVDDYLLTTAYGSKFMQDVDRYFKAVQSDRDIVSGEVLQLFSQKTKIRVTLECNPVKAARVRRRFLRYFGLTSNEMKRGA